jgi:hypothetical protein
MQHKMNRVKTLVDQVLHSRRSLGPAVIMKLKEDVMDEIDQLVNNNSQQCRCWLDNIIREHEADTGSSPSGITVPSPSEFEGLSTPCSTQEYFE